MTKRLLPPRKKQRGHHFLDLAGIENSLVRTLLTIYHGRIPYPTTIGLTKGTTDAVASPA